MTAGEAVQDLTVRFQAAGIDSARLDARVLVAFVLGVEPERVFGYPETILTEQQVSQLAVVSKRRADRQPLARIIGEREFWSLRFRLSDDTLIPRPETETVVEAVLEQVGDRNAPLKILDLGTGSGCLLISLLSELSKATGIGVDISEGALHTAAENAGWIGVANRARFIQNDWCGGLAEDHGKSFDIIVSNPPYIPDADINTLEPEVSAHEPERALAGGQDGLDIYRLLVSEIGNFLTPTGIAAFEVGFDQAEAVNELGRAEGLKVLDVRNDLAGIPRCVVFRNI